MTTSPDGQEVDDLWLVFGISLALVRTEDGGRHKPIVGTYSPDWSIPGMSEGWLVGGPVLCLGKPLLVPGETTRAVITPSSPDGLRLWETVTVGDDLQMFEGARLCGIGAVEWMRSIGRTISASEMERFVAWVEGRDGEP
jgi:hypothetical protein